LLRDAVFAFLLSFILLGGRLCLHLFFLFLVLNRAKHLDLLLYVFVALDPDGKVYVL